MKRKIIFNMILGLILGQSLFANSIMVEKYFQFSEEKFQIKSMAFDNNDKEIALVKRVFLPNEEEATSREEYVKKMWESLKSDERYFDPIIYTIDVQSKEMIQIDYGWDPAFSPDGNKIAYTKQVESLKGVAVISATVNKNTINLYNKEAKESILLASPDKEELSILENGYINKPQFLDESNIIFQIAEEANIFYGGGAGLNKVNLQDKKIEKIVPVEKKCEDTPTLINNIYLKENEVYYIHYSGTGNVDEFTG